MDAHPTANEPAAAWTRHRTGAPAPGRGASAAPWTRRDKRPVRTQHRASQLEQRVPAHGRTGGEVAREACCHRERLAPRVLVLRVRTRRSPDFLMSRETSVPDPKTTAAISQFGFERKGRSPTGGLMSLPPGSGWLGGGVRPRSASACHLVPPDRYRSSGGTSWVDGALRRTAERSVPLVGCQFTGHLGVGLRTTRGDLISDHSKAAPDDGLGCGRRVQLG